MLQRFQLNPTETITVGDRDIDILAGQAAGIFSCFFGADAGKSSPDFIFTQYDELYAFLLDRNKKESAENSGNYIGYQTLSKPIIHIE